MGKEEEESRDFLGISIDLLSCYYRNVLTKKACVTTELNMGTYLKASRLYIIL